MLRIALSLLFTSAATFPLGAIPLPASLATLPLSAPLPNGTMEIQCLPGGASIEEESCLFVRGCCSTNGILDSIAAGPGLCGLPFEDEFTLASAQYEINRQIALCHFDGHSVANVQLLLTPNASAILDSMNRPDERL
ncbi:hypothetical protein JB92DRAFT_2946385 [Gautieria morchelliformis]|nr:hypothetical protein JB92DRAFT_2946385 [Gautieria morchelliformis]